MEKQAVHGRKADVFQHFAALTGAVREIIPHAHPSSSAQTAS
jgi:hypothetical protein